MSNRRSCNQSPMQISHSNMYIPYFTQNVYCKLIKHIVCYNILNCTYFYIITLGFHCHLISQYTMKSVKVYTKAHSPMDWVHVVANISWYLMFYIHTISLLIHLSVCLLVFCQIMTVFQI